MKKQSAFDLVEIGIKAVLSGFPWYVWLAVVANTVMLTFFKCPTPAIVLFTISYTLIFTGALLHGLSAALNAKDKAASNP
jgi:hypothetical protein